MVTVSTQSKNANYIVIEKTRRQAHAPILLGKTIISPSVQQDTDGSVKLFFIFPDLAIKIQGFYNLNMSILDMQCYENSVFMQSKPITVYAPQSYPGNFGILS